jgi:hypothetical protein
VVLVELEERSVGFGLGYRTSSCEEFLLSPIHPPSGRLLRSFNRSQDSPRSSSFMPSPHGTAGSSHYLAHDDVPEATNSDDISIRTTEEIEKYVSLHRREFAHTRIYDVNLVERVGLDEELPTSSGPSVGKNSMTSLAKVRVS